MGEQAGVPWVTLENRESKRDAKAQSQKSPREKRDGVQTPGGNVQAGVLGTWTMHHLAEATTMTAKLAKYQ